MDRTDGIPNAIEGAQAVFDWFGYWPSFHDAEIIDLHLATAGPSWLSVLTWHMNRDVIESGFYRREREAIVTFTLTGIADLELADFSNQNVISSLAIEPRAHGARLILKPCYGLTGFIEAAEVRVALTPGKDATLIAMSPGPIT
jgi:Immunity protein 50